MTSTLSPADVADRHRKYLALEMLAVALLSVANAAQRVVPPEWVATTEAVQVVCVVLVLAGLIPMVTWKLRNRDRQLRRIYFSEDGFGAQALEKARSLSWVVTFVVLALFPPFVRRFDGVPAEFFLYAVLSITSGVFGTAFLILTREGAESPDA